MRSRGLPRPRSWNTVMVLLLLVAGAVLTFFLGTMWGPCSGVHTHFSYSMIQKEVTSSPSKLLPSRKAVSSQKSAKELDTKSGISKVQKYGDLCGLPDDQIEGLLKMPHGSKPWELRYSWDYKWWEIKSLWEHMASFSNKDLECVLISVAGVLPCLERECLLTLHIRPHASDIQVALQLFDKLEYSFLETYTPRTILDAGGNIGLGALIFGTMFPDATIITIEPDSDNYRMLRLNTKHLANVIPLRAGLWCKVTALRIREKYKDGGHEWEYVVEEVTKADVAAKTASAEPLDFFPAVTVDYLAQLFGVGSFDFAKIDIEGSEREVFTQESYNRLSWLPKVKLLTVEMHEGLKKGSEAAVSKTLEGTFAGMFELVSYPEYQVWTNKETIGEITNAKSQEATVVKKSEETLVSDVAQSEDPQEESAGEDPLERLVNS